ncbi:DNA (cytosine-5-)-methyltransferase [Pontiellaceae bacterium B1224]|nr:DNA (cytosine-5-)-methyltransferase [Pontiellaceae bacterium B1224]
MKKLSFKKQQTLIEESIQSKVHLAKVLEGNGYSYDSLVYRHNETSFREMSSQKNAGNPFIGRERVAGNIPAVSFFSGAGGLDLGFKAAGFDCVASVEYNEMFCDTLRANSFANVIGPPNFSGDVKNKDEIVSALKQVGISKGFNGVFHGGPPCQPFSIASNQRFSMSGENFKRTGFNHSEYGNLLFDFIELILYFKPTAFMIENVEGLLSFDNGEQVSYACDLLTSGGYGVANPVVVNAADYGVPQNRLRTIIVGSRKGEFVLPAHSARKVSCHEVLNADFNEASNHITRKHNAESVKRYMELEYGKRDKLGRVDRLNPILPSKTVIAGGTGGGGRSHLHPHIPRTLSVRESARLQTFPDSHIFTGPVARQFTQSGNAVPPVLAYEIARAIFKGVFI